MVKEENVAVTIIVPIYNVESCIAECLDSLERQSFKNFEVIMIDDGSTDSSGSIAINYSDKNANFIYISRKNGGLSAARNSGLEVARGEYIYFLDSDDYITDDAIEKLYRKAKSDNLDQIRFAAYAFDSNLANDKKINIISKEDYKYIDGYSRVYNGLEFYQDTLDKNEYYSPSCCLIFTKRSIFESNHLRFYEGILHEDILFNFQLTSLCNRVLIMNEPLYYRRIRQGSITHSLDCMVKIKSMCLCAEVADEFIEKYIPQKGNVCNWQIMFFLNVMLIYWEQMTRQEQDSLESREYFARIRPLIKKYGNGGGLPLRLFYASYPLYRAYKSIRHILGNAVHKIDGN